MTMLRGAEYKNLREGVKRGEDRISLGIDEAIRCIQGLALASDPLRSQEPERKKTEAEELLERLSP